MHETNVCLLVIKGLEGENCLRSSDCSEGLCCARHFWSKICKPVLKEGQVCTKHKRKGTHGLEIFQRCDCAGGLSCRTQSSKSSRSLHTCQRHWTSVPGFFLGLDRRRRGGKLDLDYSWFCSGFLQIVFCQHFRVHIIVSQRNVNVTVNYCINL